MQTTPQTREPRIDPGFAWDEQQVYLFDVDGTLLRCRDSIHMDSIVSSVRQITGLEVSLDGVLIPPRFSSRSWRRFTKPCAGRSPGSGSRWIWS
jgi:hypothetical protein